MRAAMSGYIMNISSTSGIRGAPCYDFYTGKKTYSYLMDDISFNFFLYHLFWISYVHLYVMQTFSQVSNQLLHKKHFFTYSLRILIFSFCHACAGSKFALEGITDSLRYTLVPFNIPITNINPGPVRWKLIFYNYYHFNSSFEYLFLIMRSIILKQLSIINVLCRYYGANSIFYFVCL